MLGSTREYLQALRAGNYFLFLDWPRFLGQQYKKSKHVELNGDDLVDLIIYEWLNNGYGEEDAKLFALVTKLNDKTPKLFSGEQEYALVSLSIAVLHCMIYCHLQLADKLLMKEKKSEEEILRLMNAHSIAEEVLEPELGRQHALFLQWVESTSTERVEEAFNKLQVLLKFRQLVHDYLEVLENTRVEGDDLRLSRLCVLQRLRHYLDDQVDLGPAVRAKIDVYANKLSELAPQAFEERYLLELSSAPLLKASRRSLFDLGFSFFRLLLPELEKKPLVKDEPSVTQLK